MSRPGKVVAALVAVGSVAFGSAVWATADTPEDEMWAPVAFFWVLIYGAVAVGVVAIVDRIVCSYLAWRRKRLSV